MTVCFLPLTMLVVSLRDTPPPPPNPPKEDEDEKVVMPPEGKPKPLGIPGIPILPKRPPPKKGSDMDDDDDEEEDEKNCCSAGWPKKPVDGKPAWANPGSCAGNAL